MARSVDLGFFRRAGASLAGRIGTLRATWDRHHGGVLTVDSTNFSAAPMTVAARVRVLAGGREILLRQEADPDPRLIVAEQGPERIWMRNMFSLLDARGAYHGDGLTDAILYADGEVRLGLCLRLVGSAAHDTVTDAWIETSLAGPVTGGQVGTRKSADLNLDKPSRYSFKRQLKGRYVAVAAKRGGLAVGFYSLAGRSIDKLGKGVGIWHSDRSNQAPWYDTWGHLYDQWNGLSGWGGHKTGRLIVEPAPARRGRRLCLNWKWLHGSAEACGATFGLRAMLGLFFDKSAGAAVERVRAFQKPERPAQAEGLEFRCLDVLEGTLLFRLTSGLASLTFPRVPAARPARIRLIGLQGAGSVGCEVNGESVPMQVLSLGGQTDDPYGPNLARPGDRFVPLVGDASRPPGEAVVSLRLSGAKRTNLSIYDGIGSALSYVKWDDRQVYAVHQGGTDSRPAALFSCRTLCLHDLQAGGVMWPKVNDDDPVEREGAAGPALVRVPLYWYPTNVQTRGHCANDARRLRLRYSPNGGVELHVLAATPNDGIRSSVTARLESTLSHVVLSVSSRAEVRGRCDLDEIQFLNAFPYDSWRPADWETDWVVTLDADGNETTYFVKEPRGRSVVGNATRHWRRAFFLAQGARDRGNVFVLARLPKGSRHRGRYVLCRVWLDSHLSIDGLKPPVRKGTRLAADYTIAIWGDKRLSRAEAIEIGRRALAEGELILG